jgi:uncharacterized membrane-anchored protein
MNTSCSTGAVYLVSGKLSRVPEITPYFWVTKILTTAMGEAVSDYLVYHINPYVAVLSGAAGFVIALVLQLMTRRYVAWIYWLMVAMVAVFGTMVADVVHIVLGVPYWLSTIGFGTALTFIFFAWRQAEGTLSIHSIFTLRRELFYWATVIATFALGTAAGDMTATTLQLGYFLSGILFTLLFVLPGILYWRRGMNEVSAFWLAYIMTRPLGASFADWLGKAREFGGLGYGSGSIGLLLTAGIIILVTYLTVTRKDVQRDVPAVDYTNGVGPGFVAELLRQDEMD